MSRRRYHHYVGISKGECLIFVFRLRSLRSKNCRKANPSILPPEILKYGEYIEVNVCYEENIGRVMRDWDGWVSCFCVQFMFCKTQMILDILVVLEY